MRSIPEWVKSLNIRLPRDVDPHPWMRRDFAPPVTADLFLGCYNVWQVSPEEDTTEDFNRIIETVGVIGWGEARMHNKGKDLLELCQANGWGFFQGEHGTDTSISWDKRLYSRFYSESYDIQDSIWKGKPGMPVAVPIVGLEDKRTGQQFYVLAAHTQVRGYKSGAGYLRHRIVMRRQYRQIREKMASIQLATWLPVFLVGDLNNGKALADKVAPTGFAAFVAKIDYLVFDERLVELIRGVVVRGIGFDHDRDPKDGPMNSDHPFVWGRFRFKVVGAPPRNG